MVEEKKIDLVMPVQENLTVQKEHSEQTLETMQAKGDKIELSADAPL